MVLEEEISKYFSFDSMFIISQFFGYLYLKELR